MEKPAQKTLVPFEKLSPAEQAQANVVVASEVVALIRSGVSSANGSVPMELESGTKTEVPYNFVIGNQSNLEGE